MDNNDTRIEEIAVRIADKTATEEDLVEFLSYFRSLVQEFNGILAGMQKD